MYAQKANGAIRIIAIGMLNILKVRLQTDMLREFRHVGQLIGCFRAANIRRLHTQGRRHGSGA